MHLLASIPMRLVRFFVISLVGIVYSVSLLVTVHYSISSGDMTLNSWFLFGFSTLTSLLFLAIGSLVWMYARDRLSAGLLFAFSVAMAMTFVVEVASDNPALSTVASIGSTVGVLTLSCFLFTFPKNYLNTHQEPLRSSFLLISIARIYIIALIVVSTILIVDSILDIWHNSTLAFIGPIRFPYFAVGLLCVLAIIIYSYTHSLSLREKQQMRLFVGGIIVTITPLLLLTILPSIFGFPSVDGRWGSAPLCLLPLLIGYSILRYQILILDSYARRFVAGVIGVAFLSGLIYVVVAVCSIQFQPGGQSSKSDALLFLFCVLTVMAVLSPIIWSLAQRLTDHLFFSEMVQFRKTFDKLTFMNKEPVDIDDATGLLISAIKNTFYTPRVAIFLLDESMGLYRLTPEFIDASNQVVRDHVLKSLQDVLHIQQTEDYPVISYIGKKSSIIEKLSTSQRPMLLSEVMRNKNDKLLGLDRFFVLPAHLDYEDCLLAPIRAQGEMLGILIIGERPDHQPYAGPDFEIVQMLVGRFSPFLNSARLYENAHRHTVLLNNLYSLTVMPSYIFKTVDDIAQIYTSAASKAAQANAEIWWYEEQTRQFQFASRAGHPSFLSSYNLLHTNESKHWSACFFQGDQKPKNFPSCLPVTPASPFAWLPLQKENRLFGVLLLSYTRPHVFSREEKRVLEMFANQCVATLENVSMNKKLIAARDRLEEVDKLKDQFIVTASHELRTPLTAVMGYIELLSDYYTTLPPERIDEFVEHARRGCDELLLLVENIMDASRVGIGEEQAIKLRSVAVKKEIQHVLEILEGTCVREQRRVTVEVQDNLLVAADGIRLRQILLNLLNNALKYSQKGTSIEINAEEQGQNIVIHIRDYGYGIPPREQNRLFERFIRLDRDINSPTRGAGLGLFICKQLVEAMHGRIWVESGDLPGGGSIFSFALTAVPQRQQETLSIIQLPA